MNHPRIASPALLALAATSACLAFTNANAVPALHLQTGDVHTDRLANLLTTPSEVLDDADAHYVIQLDGPLTPQRKQQLAAAGVQLGDYLPKNAYIVRLDAAAAVRVAGLGFVRWAGTYRSDWKIAPRIGDRPYFTPERQQTAARGEVMVDVTLFEDADSDAATVAIAAIDGVRVHRRETLAGNPTVTLTMPLANLPLLAGIAAVQFVEEAPEVVPRNSTNRWIVQSNIVNVTPLYDNGIHGEGQIIGVMDGRVDVNHCSFRDANNPIGPNHRKILAYNTSQGADLHGTHVAGIAVGDADADDNTRGIAYLARLVYNTIPSFTESGMYSFLNTHHTQGARLHTNSWGNDGTTAYDGLCRGIDSFSYDFEDSLILFAVTNLSSLKNPENAKNLLAVGASQDTPSQANHCSGGAGPTSDLRRKPEIYAPGCATNSSWAGHSCDTTALTGTSMASPAVAGTGLLVRQYYTDGYYPTGVANAPDSFVPSAALIKATLLNSAVDMTGISGYPSNLEGWGRVRADGGLYFAGDARGLVVRDVRNADGLATNDVVEEQIAVTGSTEQLRVTLVWTEPPASAGAAQAWINNLDLEVVAPTSDLYRGNVFSNGRSATGGTADDRNNVEQVHLDNPQSGIWTVRIRGAAVNVGTQGYALVITGEVQLELPAFTMSVPNGTPAVLAPNTPTSFDVRIVPGAENIVPGSPALHYRYDGGSFVSAPLAPAGGDLYTATLPAARCEDVPEFYLSAEGDGGTLRTLPDGAPTELFSAAVGTFEVTVDDPLEVDSGWTVGAPDDDATTGVWTRMDPEGTPAQPEDDHTPGGVNCWVTDGRAGGTIGDFDVDDGKTTLFSPLLDVSTMTDPIISYWRWYSNSAGANPNADTFVVEVSDGGPWVNVETVGPSGSGTSGGWIYHEFHLTDFVTASATVQVRFIASDLGSPSIVEAAIDDFRVEQFVCDDGGCPADLDGDGVVGLEDLTILLANYGAAGGDPDGDIDGDGDVDLEDLTLFLAAYGSSC